MRGTTKLMASGLVLVAISIYVLYIGGLTFVSFSIAVTLLWIAAFLILIARAARKVSETIRAKT